MLQARFILCCEPFYSTISFVISKYNLSEAPYAIGSTLGDQGEGEALKSLWSECP